MGSVWESMKSAFSDVAANVPGEPKIWDRLSFVSKHLRERLWIRPLIVCVFSIDAAFLANLMDSTELGRSLPDITREAVETLLKIVASSMLMMATFAVGSMVAAHASASRSATPRSFPLILGDDVSQNALSAFAEAWRRCRAPSARQAALSRGSSRRRQSACPLRTPKQSLPRS